MTQEIVKATDFGLENDDKAVIKIKEAFQPKIAEREGLVEAYQLILKSELCEELVERAGTLRKQLMKVRTGIASVHKTQKEFFLASGRYVDAWKNKETLPVTQMEEKLHEIENHFANIEKERIAKVQEERYSILHGYGVEMIPMDLGTLSEEMWVNFETGAKVNFENKQAAEAKAEAERIEAEQAAAAEQTRVRDENKRLKEEALERERVAQVEANKRQAAAKIEDDKRRKEQVDREAKAEATRKVHEAEMLAQQQAKAKSDAAAKAERDRLEAALRVKTEAEEKAKADELEREQNELNKGDAAKVRDLIASLEELKTKFSFKSKKNNEMYEEVGRQIDLMVDTIARKTPSKSAAAA